MHMTDGHSQVRMRIGKRLLDITVVLLALPLALPMMGLIAALVWSIEGSPVLFRQLRPGLHGKPFTIYKFRTMRERRDSFQLTDGERLTRLGKFLRSTSLDELPELINVIRGEMSLIGPRPLLMEYLEHYTPELQRRHHVLPGITGWAQLNGRNTANWERRFALDLWYVDHQSMALDLKILLMTPWKVIRREGVVHPDDPSWGTPFQGISSEPSRTASVACPPSPPAIKTTD
jgi:sugar transferase EpsL